jgi:hypothetical protein
MAIKEDWKPVLTYTFEDVLGEANQRVFILHTFENGVQIGGDTIHNNEAEAKQAEINYVQQGFVRVLSHPQRLQLITEWNNAAQQQKFWRDRELSFRTTIVGEMYTLETGTQRIDLESGWQLKIERGLEYKLNNKEGQVDKVLESELIPEVLAKLLINWKPEVVRKTYDTMTAEQKALFADCLDIKPSSPQVELVPPKASKG